MTSNKENSSESNPSGGHGHRDENTTSTNVQDQTLLKALQDLILRIMGPMQKNVHSGPEAEKLITALQEFIFGIIMRTKSGVQQAIEINLDEEEDKVQRGNPNNDENESPLMNISFHEPEDDVIIYNHSCDLDTSQKSQPTFEDKVLKTLREHVFNTMPIRLLCFEPYKTSFRIVLLERGAIYARLAPILERKMHAGKFLCPEDWIGEIGTDKETIKQLVSKHAQYAILSHTWLRTAPGEVTYGDWNKGSFDAQSPGYRKLVNFCKVAWRDHGLVFGWMDTVCINKDSSSELDESIRSMYNWYSRAAMCIIYLAETGTLSHMHIDPWFTRGWTLQELLAPQFIKFYNNNWKRLADNLNNDKKDSDITQQIEQATTISRDELDDIVWTPISRRMQLAATREVTREEDMAYSLMGIFNVSISTAYGEGASRAFFRLLQEILATETDGALDVLNWAGELPSTRPYSSQVLPSSPKCYMNRSSDECLTFTWPIEPLTLTHLGLRVPLILMPGISIHDTQSHYDPIGDYTAIVNIASVDGGSIYFPTTYNLLDSRVFGGDGMKVRNGRFQMTFAVFNFTRVQNAIYIPETCMSIGLLCEEAAGEVTSTTVGATTKIETQEPIVFTLAGTDIDAKGRNDNDDSWEVELDELPRHGMQLVSLYL